MTTDVPTNTIDSTPQWAKLLELGRRENLTELGAAFATDGERASRFTFQVCDLRVDLSKNLISEAVVEELVALGEVAGLTERIEEMFDGIAINTSEARPVLHTALRRPRTDTVMVGGANVVADVHAVLEQMAGFSVAVRSGAWIGTTGEPITTVVNIGIGGSDLGPKMAALALEPYASVSMNSHFVSNVDPADLGFALAGANAETTLFIVVSKSFTTTETMTNAGHARQWLTARLGPGADISKHFVAVSTNESAVREFGIESGQHVPLLGLGRRPLFAVLSRGPQLDGRDWSGALPGDARWIPRHGSSLSHCPAGRQWPSACRLDRNLES